MQEIMASRDVNKYIGKYKVKWIKYNVISLLSGKKTCSISEVLRYLCILLE